MTDLQPNVQSANVQPATTLITGQDEPQIAQIPLRGTRDTDCLAGFLLAKGYEVQGVSRRASSLRS